MASNGSATGSLATAGASGVQPGATPLSFLDAAEQVLRSSGGTTPLHYSEITRRAIQRGLGQAVKRWRNNVQPPAVAALRGSLCVHDRGLIVTTSDFIPGARQQAQRPNVVPISLMNGDELIDLLVEHEIGVLRQLHDVLELKP